MTVAITPKLTVLRALSAVVARRVLRLFLIITSLFLVLGIITIWAFAHFFSVWWWLLLIVYLPVLVVAMTAYLLSRFIVWRLYPVSLSREQTRHLRDFSDKLVRLLETRGLSWWWFAIVCVKDLLVYRELRMLKTLLGDATSLRDDFVHLEKELNN